MYFVSQPAASFRYGRVDGWTRNVHPIFHLSIPERSVRSWDCTSYRNSLYDIQHPPSCRDDPKVVLTTT